MRFRLLIASTWLAFSLWIMLLFSSAPVSNRVIGAVGVLVLFAIGQWATRHFMVDPQTDTPVKCPACGEGIPGSTKSCRFCGKKFPKRARAAVQASQADNDQAKIKARARAKAASERTAFEESPRDIICAACGFIAPAGSERCPSCDALISLD